MGAAVPSPNLPFHWGVRLQIESENGWAFVFMLLGGQRDQVTRANVDKSRHCSKTQTEEKLNSGFGFILWKDKESQT